MLTELLEKEKRFTTVVGAVHSQPWVAFAKQGSLLIKMFNYNSVIEDGKGHLGMPSIPNREPHRRWLYFHFPEGDHALGYILQKNSKYLDEQKVFWG